MPASVCRSCQLFLKDKRSEANEIQICTKKEMMSVKAEISEIESRKKIKEN